MGEQRELLALAKAKILQRLMVLSHDFPEVKAVLSGDYWKRMPAEEFSFAVTGMISMPGDMAQALLEETAPQQRLDSILEMISGVRV